MATQRYKADVSRGTMQVAEVEELENYIRTPNSLSSASKEWEAGPTL